MTRIKMQEIARSPFPPSPAEGGQANKPEGGEDDGGGLGYTFVSHVDGAITIHSQAIECGTRRAEGSRLCH